MPHDISLDLMGYTWCLRSSVLGSQRISYLLHDTYGRAWRRKDDEEYPTVLKEGSCIL